MPMGYLNLQQTLIVCILLCSMLMGCGNQQMSVTTQRAENSILKDGQPVTISLDAVENKSVLSSGDLEVTFNAIEVAAKDSFLINIYMVDNDASSADKEYLDTASFFPPLRQGENSTLTFDIEAGLKADSKKELVFELVPADPASISDISTLQVVKARVIP